MAQTYREVAALCLLTLSACAIETAPLRDELKIGYLSHDTGLTVTERYTHRPEKSGALSADYIMPSVPQLRGLYSPRPFVGASINTDGKTSFGSAGLMWRSRPLRRTYVDYTLGVAVHNGTKDISPQDPNLQARLENEIQFGSPVLLRAGVSLGYDIDRDWALEATWDHYSHAYYASRTNQGIDNIGLRVVRRF